MKTELKGTPGPYTYKQIADNKYGARVFRIDGRNGGIKAMAHVYSSENLAKLFTAAPELLEALQNLVTQFKRVEPLYSKDKELIEAAEGAINKALNK